MIKMSTDQKVITVLNLYVSNDITSKCIKAKVEKVKKKINIQPPWRFKNTSLHN